MNKAEEYLNSGSKKVFSGDYEGVIRGLQQSG